jgi:hypothetical protein
MVAPSMLGHGTSPLRIESQRQWAMALLSSGDYLDGEVTMIDYVLSLDPRISKLSWHLHGIAWWTETGTGSRVP